VRSALEFGIASCQPVSAARRRHDDRRAQDHAPAAAGLRSTTLIVINRAAPRAGRGGEFESTPKLRERFHFPRHMSA
jgi:hypothetical protein